MPHRLITSAMADRLLQSQLAQVSEKQAQTITTTINNILSIIQSVSLGLLHKY